MPTKSYTRFTKNMETVNRLEETYEEIRTRRNRRGKAAYDHITRSAIIFLASAFEVYIEDVAKECCNQHISFAGDASKLPNDVKNTINNFVKKDKNAEPPIMLCDEGWRRIYRIIAEQETGKLNTPKKQQIQELFNRLIGISTTKIDDIPNIEDLDSVITFRGEIAHRVKAEQYVKIEQVKKNVQTVKELVVEIDKMIINYFRDYYPEKRVPWNNSYNI